MKISEILTKAWELISQPGAHSRNAFARSADGDPVHALHEGAVSWDSTGALKKVVGNDEDENFRWALGALGASALAMKAGVLQVNDMGDAAALRTMWMGAIRKAVMIEQQMATATHHGATA
jgi:hypothetical protein